MDNRVNYLVKLIRGKNVLDLGPGDTSDRFLHKYISQYAKNATGVELDNYRANKLKNSGYKIICGNAETINLKKKFDIIIAGDLIEHVNNPGLLLQNVKRHLKNDGIFYFNTPNTYSINMLFRGLFLRGYVKQFPEHVNLFTQELIEQLLYRYGFKIKKVQYFSHNNPTLGSFIIRFFSFFSKRWHENISFEVVKDEKTK